MASSCKRSATWSSGTTVGQVHSDRDVVRWFGDSGTVVENVVGGLKTFGDQYDDSFLVSAIR